MGLGEAGGSLCSNVSWEGPHNGKKKIVKMLSRRHGSVPNLQVSTALDRVREQSSSQFTVQFIFFFFWVLRFASSPWLPGLHVSNFPQCLKCQASVGSKQTPGAFFISFLTPSAEFTLSSPL